MMVQGTAGAKATHTPTTAPAGRGGMGGAVAVAESESRPMACHIGHISPEINEDCGHISPDVEDNLEDRKSLKVVIPKPDGEMTIEIWDKHVRIKRPCHTLFGKQSPRGIVKGLSFKAGRRLRWAIENTPELCTKEALFICLTYPNEWPKDGREVKRHLDNFGKRCRRLGAFFVWALEYQTRGAPHFHLLARFPDNWSLKRVREWLRLNWYEVVNSGDEKHLKAGTSAEFVEKPEAAGWYVSHYLGKEYQKLPPENVTYPGRMWGMIGIKTPKPIETRYFKEGSKEGIKIARLIRRWASSDYAFRQRTKPVSIAVRIEAAEHFSFSNPELARSLRDFKNKKFIEEVKPKDRKSWSPRDAGREQGFSVRNASCITKQLVSLIT